MKPTITVTGEAWFWQVGKIKRAMQENGGFLGKYHYQFSGDTQVTANIRIFKIKPFIWRKLLRHELRHHEITQKATSFEEAKKLNAEYDHKTRHGLCELWY